MKKSILITVFMFVVSLKGYSHYLWVETAPQGSLNQEQEIRVYYGEYTYGVMEEVKGKAFPAVSEFSLWVLDGNGSKTELVVTPKENYYLAHFTPKSNGTYTILLDNDNIDVIDYTQYDFGIFKTHYHSVTRFQVGEYVGETTSLNDNGISLKYLPSQGDEIKLQVFFKSKPLANNEVKVYVADLWSKSLETKEDGFVSFKLPWKTKYTVETTFKEETPGKYRGKKYDFIWHCATTCIQ
ncbi:DUF4198 domain-containing protein [Arenibacter sp. S6351L]|uniref:DUF4198 domain-containing protein n=1 Tax=Arenibacter sp. S6351L TaxID=2926407 RepID=UPI001FF382CA|nr:DUF4198 domain-containing protein [Arenibacter sp. S6351L]MCK0136058.1 DUF4198 domain-containing protein [Arenibacter sp. S6351L]